MLYAAHDVGGTHKRHPRPFHQHVRNIIPAGQERVARSGEDLETCRVGQAREPRRRMNERGLAPRGVIVKAETDRSLTRRGKDLGRQGARQRLRVHGVVAAPQHVLLGRNQDEVLVPPREPQHPQRVLARQAESLFAHTPSPQMRGR